MGILVKYNRIYKYTIDLSDSKYVVSYPYLVLNKFVNYFDIA